MSNAKAPERTETLVIGARGSMLSVTQTEQVADSLRKHYPALNVTIKKFTTRGDRTQDRDKPIAAVGTKGLFTAELEEALADGSIDLAVHSAKDVPADLADGTDILAWPRRADPRDALIIGPDALAPGSVDDLPPGALMGTSSLRRAGQLLAMRPDLKVAPIRGNIETRIRKVREGQFAATILAAAGLGRAGMLDQAAWFFEVHQMTPSGGQGVLALQGRAGDDRVRGLLSALDHEPTRLAVTAERHVIRQLGGGCNMPLGVFAESRADGGGLHGIAVLCHPSGKPRIAVTADAADPQSLGEQLVERLLAQNGAALLNVE